MQEDKITQDNVKKWIENSKLSFCNFDGPGIYVHRSVAVNYNTRFFINFCVRTGKLLVYLNDETKLKKKILFATTNKNEMLDKNLYELYIKAQRENKTKEVRK